MAKKKVYQVPFAQDGRPLSWAYKNDTNVVWVDNYEFEATLRFDSFFRGRSAANAKWLDCTEDEGLHYLSFAYNQKERPEYYTRAGWYNAEGKPVQRKEYNMFLTDLGHILKLDGITMPLTGVWTFQKRGANIGIRLLRVIDPLTREVLIEQYEVD